MDRSERPFCIIKFGKKKRLQSLLNNGELFFNTTENLNRAQRLNIEQGDENEGAQWIKNIQFSEIKVNHPRFGEYKFKPVPNTLGKLTQFNHNYLTCSFFIITTNDFENTDILKVDEKMLEFGEHALLIKEPKIFLDSIIEALEFENFDYSARKVKYKNLRSEGHIEIDPFIKKLEHQHQKEFRIIIKNELEPKLVRIRDIRKIGEIVTSKYIVESKWEATRK